MSVRYRMRLYDFEIVPWHTIGRGDSGGGETLGRFPAHALRSARDDPRTMAAIRRLVARSSWLTPVDRFTDEEVLEHLSRQIEAGRIRLAPVRRGTQVGQSGEGPAEVSEAPRGSGGEAGRKATPVPEPSPPANRPAPARPSRPRPSPPMLHWITIGLVDEESGGPLAGVAVRVRAPDGNVLTRTTGSDGKVHLPQLPEGTCDLEELVDVAFEVIDVN